jgi:hypothetical protein
MMMAITSADLHRLYNTLVHAQQLKGGVRICVTEALKRYGSANGVGSRSVID